jgi:YHS domain-containing protein
VLLRTVLFIILAFFLARALWRLIDGIIEGASGGARRGVPQRGVQMARDPICGTFVVPERALALTDGTTQHYFCSETCREKYRAGRGGRAAGRTA